MRLLDKRGRKTESPGCEAGSQNTASDDGLVDDGCNDDDAFLLQAEEAGKSLVRRADLVAISTPKCTGIAASLR